jgi:hypothetical protein
MGLLASFVCARFRRKGLELAAPEAGEPSVLIGNPLAYFPGHGEPLGSSWIQVMRVDQDLGIAIEFRVRVVLDVEGKVRGVEGEVEARFLDRRLCLQ